MAINRDVVMTLIELAPNVNEADNVISKNYGFKTIEEKVAFLKGMFDIKIIGHEKDKPNETTYWVILDTIINAHRI